MEAAYQKRENIFRACFVKALDCVLVPTSIYIAALVYKLLDLYIEAILSQNALV